MAFRVFELGNSFMVVKNGTSICLIVGNLFLYKFVRKTCVLVQMFLSYPEIAN